MRATLAGIAVISLAIICGGCDPVQQSHIRGNVPVSEDFDQFMVRGLTAYFRTEYGDGVSVDYQLLRQGPTQSGVAYPKYYVWVVVRRGTTVLAEGACRLAAIDRRLFEVTSFVSVASIRESPMRIYSIFPAPVCKTIEGRIRDAK